MGLVDKFLTGTLDKRFIWFILLVVTVIPIIIPLGLPIGIRDSTKQFYDFIETLPEGSKVLMDVDLDPSGYITLGPGMVAISHHLFDKKMKVFYVAFIPNGPAQIEIIINEMEKTGHEYGVDYINLGYIPGAESGMYAFSDDVSMGQKDYRGVDLSTLSIMSGTTKLEDFSLIIFTVYSNPDSWFRQWGGRGVPIFMHVEPAGLPLLMPYYQSGLCGAYVQGPRGAAEYELLTRHLGEGIKLQDMTNITLIFGIFLILIGNVGFFYKKGGNKK